MKLVSGTTLSQILAVLVSPILTRLYAPQAFGVSALFGTITTILGVIVCMRYEMAVMLPASDEDAANVLGVCLVSVLLVSLLTVPVIGLGSGPLLRLLRADELRPYVWLLPLSVLIAGLLLALNYWNSRTRHFGRLSIAQATGSVATAGAQIGLGHAGPASGGSLIAANIFGSAVSTAVLGGQILRQDGPFLRQAMARGALVAAAKRYHRFALFGTPSALLNTISWSLPTLLLQSFFSTAVVGYYALGNRLLGLPMSLIGGAIGQVFFQRAAEAKLSGSLASLVENAFRRLVTLSLFPMLVLAIVSRDLFVLLFGARWAEAGVYTQILAVWTFFWFLSSPLSTVFSVLEKQEFGLKLNVVIFVTRFLSLAAGGILGQARLALVLFSASGVVVYGYYSFAILAASGVPLASAFRHLGRSALVFFPAGAILVALKALRVSSWAQLAVAGLLLAGFLAHALRREPAFTDLVKGLGVLPR